MSTATGDRGVPLVVAIVAMGLSHREYFDECVVKSSRFAVADETWAVNVMAGIIQHDRAFIMDDLEYFAKESRFSPHLVGYKDWLHKATSPIYTSEPHVGFPASVRYPIEDVVQKLGYAYFNNTTAYAIAYAIYLGVREIKLFGVDFSDSTGNAFYEAGRGCVEFWLRDAAWRNIKVTIANSSSLCDQSTGRVLYGYSNPPKL